MEGRRGKLGAEFENRLIGRGCKSDSGCPSHHTSTRQPRSSARPRRLPPAARYVPRPPGFNHFLDLLPPSTTTMLAVQKPVALFSSPQAHLHRPSHSRHPSAPVVIRPTQTPGLLSLSKPAQPQQRQQQPQQHARAPRSSPKGKQQRSPQPAPAQAQAVEDGKKAKASRARAVSPSDKSSKPANAPSAEKSPRGRQSAKSSSPKEKADKR